MQIEIKGPFDLHVASRIVEQIQPIQKLMTKVYGQETTIREIEFYSATVGSCGGYGDGAYYWEINFQLSSLHDGLWRNFDAEYNPEEQDSEIATYLKAVLSWMYSMEEVDSALGQEFGLFQPMVRIEV